MLLIFLLAILIPACVSSSPAFLMMYSAYKLNKQGDNIQPWCTPFPIWNQSVVPCPVLTLASWPAYRFLKRQVRWSGSPISFRIFHSLLLSTQSKALAWWIKQNWNSLVFFNDPANVGKLISGSSAFSKTSLNIWKFTGHVLLKPDLENFEHYFTSVWDECNCMVVWAFFGIAFLWDWNENWPFPVLWPLLSFPWSYIIKKKKPNTLRYILTRILKLQHALLQDSNSMNFYEYVTVVFSGYFLAFWFSNLNSVCH